MTNAHFLEKLALEALHTLEIRLTDLRCEGVKKTSNDAFEACLELQRSAYALRQKIREAARLLESTE